MSKRMKFLLLTVVAAGVVLFSGTRPITLAHGEQVADYQLTLGGRVIATVSHVFGQVDGAGSCPYVDLDPCTH